MVKFSMLMMATFLVGLFMFTAGVACIFKGIGLYQSEDEPTGTLAITIGVVLLVFGPVIMVIAIVYFIMRARQLRDSGQW